AVSRSISFQTAVTTTWPCLKEWSRLPVDFFDRPVHDYLVAEFHRRGSTFQGLKQQDKRLGSHRSFFRGCHWLRAELRQPERSKTVTRRNELMQSHPGTKRRVRLARRHNS
ncbi:unnamed protein product, partial [Ixodes pacificus]